MTRHQALILAAALLGSALLTHITRGATTPNIIFILADDMSYDSVSAFNDQIGDMKTPELDKLVSQGMYFTDGHSPSSVCTPTRYGLLTGRYCWRSRLKKEVLWTYGRPLIADEQLTIPELLKEAGYQTGMVGKWHLGTAWKDAAGLQANRNLLDSDKTWRDAKQKIADMEKTIDFSKPFEGGPRDHGFDYYFGVDLPNMPPYIWLEGRQAVGTPSVPKPEIMFGTPGLMKKDWKLEDILPGLGDKASAWVTQAAKQQEPFFLYMPLTSPHTPISPSKAFAGKSPIGLYADFVHETDHVVGRVMNALEETGEAGNTLFIFSTDNGTAARANFKNLEKHGVNLHNHFRGHKGMIYEGGHRVPLIMRWPDVIPAGTHNDQTVGLNDFLATFAEMTGRELKDNEGVDSFSIWPIITGKKKTLPDHPGLISHNYQGQYSIRDGNWKLILPLTAEGKYELYDLDGDSRESTNVAARHPERVAEMTAQLKRYVDEGRSTPGPTQQNHAGKTAWIGLPW